MTALIQQKLENSSGLKLKLKINDNRSTMLSVKWEPDCAKVSLHRMFLQAPQNVMDALACYLSKQDKVMAPSVKAFIEDNLKNLDYSSKVDRSKLHTQGNVYNLQKVYEGINDEYFEGSLNLAITWFGKPIVSNRSRITLGLYYDSLKLIKVNRLLDNPSFPDYLVSYVVYHEMLHHVSPPYFDSKGHHHIHSREFKEKERLFRHYHLAEKWIAEHRKTLFYNL